MAPDGNLSLKSNLDTVGGSANDYGHMQHSISPSNSHSVNYSYRYIDTYAQRYTCKGICCSNIYNSRTLETNVC